MTTIYEAAEQRRRAARGRAAAIGEAARVRGFQAAAENGSRETRR
jgi:hypothetical protein